MVLFFDASLLMRMQTNGHVCSYADTVGMLDSGELKKKLDAAGIKSNL